jgi:hypothetical protein
MKIDPQFTVWRGWGTGVRGDEGLTVLFLFCPCSYLLFYVDILAIGALQRRCRRCHCRRHRHLLTLSSRGRCRRCCCVAVAIVPAPAISAQTPLSSLSLPLPSPPADAVEPRPLQPPRSRCCCRCCCRRCSAAAVVAVIAVPVVYCLAWMGDRCAWG